MNGERVHDARRSLELIAADARARGTATERATRLSVLWAEARYALEHLSAGEEHLRDALAAIERTCAPAHRTRADHGRALERAGQRARTALAL